MSAVTHPRLAARRGTRALSWWGKAWMRGVEEAAYHTDDLRRGRALARAGAVGAITVDAGSLLAAVQVGDDAWTVQVEVPVLDRDGVTVLVELVASESGRIAALLGGDLPHQLVEDAEESGVELLPYGTELAAECACQAWAQPCEHALAVLTQVGWLLAADPLQLLLLRGLAREELLSRLAARGSVGVGADADDPAYAADLETAAEAALRATKMLEVLADDGEIGHLL
ncbi:hypothetical protein [Nocardioides sp. AE5]|uniref:SWIM zinc finger family protein n=1 Tax=Nocardioides sp. AE5 TaxID=2962573 RepID=UPI002881C5CA|nr:hypothetical protein [Nocardioides sp. AE5]MDT0202341.1 hypothetical protein [Nocardioides sp. AE5]